MQAGFQAWTCIPHQCKISHLEIERSLSTAQWNCIFSSPGAGWRHTRDMDTNLCPPSPVLSLPVDVTGGSLNVTAQQHQGELFIIPGNEDRKPVCIPLRGVIQCVQQWQRTFTFSNIYITLSGRLSLMERRHDTRPGNDASSMVRGCSISTFCSTHTFI